MADYWKSIEKKYCNFCRTWITNNKASVQFHERGRKHKSNVEKKLRFLTRQKNPGDDTAQENAEILARLDKDDLINNKQENPNTVPTVSTTVEAYGAESEASTSAYNPDYVQSLVKAKMTWEVVGVTDIEEEQPKKRSKKSKSDEHEHEHDKNNEEESSDDDGGDGRGADEPVFVVKEKVLETSTVSTSGPSTSSSGSFAFKKHKFNKKNIRGRQNLD